VGVTCVSKVDNDEDTSMGFETLMPFPLFLTRINRAFCFGVR